MNKIFIYFKCIASVLIMLVISFESMASTPTMEGLFKNLSNQPVMESWVIIKTKIKLEQILDVENTQGKDYYLKIYLNERNKNQIDLAYSVFTSPDFSPKSMIDARFLEDLNTFIAKGNDDFSMQFYSLMTMLGLNNSKPITAFLKKKNVDFNFNKDIVSTEKVKMLESYYNFLKSGQDIESPSNPLKANSENDKNKLSELTNSRFYKTQPGVKLVKTGNELNWHLKLENIDAFFDVESYKIKRYKSTFEDQVNSYVFSNYLLMDGSHEFPKNIQINNEGKMSAIMTILDVNYTSDKNGLLKKQILENLKLKLVHERDFFKYTPFLIQH